MKNFVLLTLLFLFGIKVNAQKSLFLEPLAGIQWVTCTSGKNTDNRQVFGASKGMVTENHGLLLSVVLNDKWEAAAGWSKGNIGWGYTLIMPNEITKNPGGIGSKQSRIQALNVHRFPVLFRHNFAHLGAGVLSEEKEAGRLNLKCYVQVGLSLDKMPAYYNSETNLGTRISDSNGDSSIYNFTAKSMHAWNYSTISGLGAQLYIGNKPSLNILIYYSQGLREMIRQDVAYQLNSLKGRGIITSRGSVIGASVSYPIRLKTFERKSV